MENVRGELMKFYFEKGAIKSCDRTTTGFQKKLYLISMKPYPHHVNDFQLASSNWQNPVKHISSHRVALTEHGIFLRFVFHK